MPLAVAAGKLRFTSSVAPTMVAARARFMTLVNAILTVAVTAGVLYAGAMAWLWLGQEKLLFAPSTLAAQVPLAMAPDVHELAVDVPGAQLSALHLRLPDPKGVVFFLHGNGGSLQTWFVNPEYYRRANFDLFMIDYRVLLPGTSLCQSQHFLSSGCFFHLEKGS